MPENRDQNPSDAQQRTMGGIGGRTGPRAEGPQDQNNASGATPHRDSLSQNPGKESERRPIPKAWTDGSGKL